VTIRHRAMENRGLAMAAMTYQMWRRGSARWITSKGAFYRRAHEERGWDDSRGTVRGA
jgi:hypothetical protein